MSRDYQPVTISDDVWLVVFFFNSTNTLLREGLNSYTPVHLNFGPQVQAPSTPRNKYYSSFRKELTRLDLRTRLARRLKLRAPRSHPHFPFLVFSPRSLFLPHLHRCGLAALTLHTGEHRRGSNSQRSPEIRGRPHHTLGCWCCAAAISDEHPG